MEPTILKLLVGVTAMLPMLIAIGGTALTHKTTAESSQRMVIRVITPSLWLASIIALLVYWSYFDHWQVTNGGPVLNDGPIIVFALVVFHSASAAFAISVMTDKITEKPSRQEVV